MNCQHLYGGHPCRSREEHHRHKRQDAEERDAKCPPERRKINRLRMVMQPTPDFLADMQPVAPDSATRSKRRRNRKARQDRLKREAAQA